MNTELPPTVRKAQEIIQSAQTENGWMSKDEYDRLSAELRKLGVMVVTTTEDDEPPATDERGRTFFEVMIHPFAVQIADEDGDPIDEEDQWSFNTSGSEWSDEYGDHPEDYPDDMFRTGWSVSSWVRVGDNDEHMDEVDDEEFSDFEAANAFAELLAEKYNVPVDHRY